MSTRLSPGSPSQMMAALFLRGPVEVAIEAVVAGVDLAADEPLGVRLVPDEHLVPRLEPVQRLGLLGPEALGIVLGRAARAVSYSARLLTWALAANSAGGGKVRVSLRTLVMLDAAGEDMSGASEVGGHSKRARNDSNGTGPNDGRLIPHINEMG